MGANVGHASVKFNDRSEINKCYLQCGANWQTTGY